MKLRLFTSTETLFLIAMLVIIGALAHIIIDQRNADKPLAASSINRLKINDVVYIPSIVVTGVVNSVYRHAKAVDIITDRGTLLRCVDSTLLKKAYQLEK